MNQEPNPIRNAFLADAQYMSTDKKLREDMMVQMQVAQYGKEQFIKQIIPAGQSKGKKIIFIYGKTQPEDKFMPQFVGKLASLIHPTIDKGFILIYCNTGLMTHSNLKTFLRQYQILPVEFFQNLEKFYILHGNMFVKSWFWFQKVIQIWALKQKVVYVSKVKDFRDFDFFQQEQLKLLPQECFDGTQNQLQFDTQLIEQKPEKQVFFTRLDQYELNANGIPINLDLVTSQLLNHKQILEEEGIFRVSCSNQQKQELEGYLRLQQYQMLNDFVDGPTLAAFIKRFYDILEEPLFLFENYVQISQFKLEDYNFISNLIDSLPKLNQTILKFTIALLHRIQLYKEKNKMTSYNLAAVLGVSLVRPRQYTVADIQKQIIQNQIQKKVLKQQLPSLRVQQCIKINSILTLRWSNF